MQSFVLDSDKYGYWVVGFIFLCTVWFILDYFYVHKTPYSIHRILQVGDNIYRIICVGFVLLGISVIFLLYLRFARVEINSDIKLFFLKPKPPVHFSIRSVKLYNIIVPKNEKYRENKILVIYLKNGKIYKSVSVGPEYHYHLYQLISFLDKIIQENSKDATFNQ